MYEKFPKDASEKQMHILADEVKTENKITSLYPERPSANIESRVQKFIDIESGREKTFVLSEEEREFVLEFESGLEKLLENVTNIKSKSVILYPGYFSEDEGRADFESMTNTVFDEKFESVLQTLQLAGKIEYKDIELLGARSRKYVDQSLEKALLQTVDDSGHLDIRGQENLQSIEILLEPKKNVQKIESFRSLKWYLKNEKDSLEKENDKERSYDERMVLLGVIELYQAKINQLLATEIIKTVTQAKRRSSNNQIFARYDKFIYGASKRYNERGQRPQVDSDLEMFADMIESDYTESMISRDAMLQNKNLSTEKIEKKMVPISKVREYAEKTLQSYGLLSNYPATEYESNRIGPAPDGKWQIIISEKFSSMSVNGEQRVVKIPDKDQSIVNFISVTLAHEIESHVLQNENKAKIKLKLFEKRGSGRSDIFAECGAMNNQDSVSREAFGFASVPHVHYVRAITKKLEGGNYLDCVNAFYESAMKVPRIRKDRGDIVESEFSREMQKNLRLAIDRVRRFFRPNSDVELFDNVLTKSKETVYIEQIRLFQELRKYGLEKYIFLNGVNLDVLPFLLKAGFLESENIQQSKGYALEVWKKMESDYRL